MATSHSPQIVEVEAESLEKAREQIKSHVSQGLFILSEKVISDGKPRTVKGVAETMEVAYTKAHGEIPAHAEILEKRELVTPNRKVITVEAFDERGAESSARSQARQQLGRGAIVKSLKLRVAGRKGFLGLGAKPNQYEAELLQEAIVEITYRVRAKISAEIGDKESELCRRAEQIEAELAEVERELKRAYTSPNDAAFANIMIAAVEETLRSGGRSGKSPLLRQKELKKELDFIHQQLAVPPGDNQGMNELARQGDEKDVLTTEPAMSIFDAAERGDSNAIVSQIGSGGHVNAKDTWGNTALIWAAWKGHANVAKILIDAKADVNAKDNDGQTALMKAADKGHTDIVILLIDAKANVNAKDKNGLTSLIIAAQNGHTNVIKTLINAKANFHTKDNDGLTALRWASLSGHDDVIGILKDAGAE